MSIPEHRYGWHCWPFDPNGYYPDSLEYVMGLIRSEVERLQEYREKILRTVHLEHRFCRTAWTPPIFPAWSYLIVEEKEVEKYRCDVKPIVYKILPEILKVDVRPPGTIEFSSPNPEVGKIARRYLDAYLKYTYVDTGKLRERHPDD